MGAFVPMSFPVGRRRSVEEALVARHAEAVRAGGVAGWNDPWLDYRRGVLRRAIRIVEIASTFPGAVYGPALHMVSERCITAAVDHRVGDLIA